MNDPEPGTKVGDFLGIKPIGEAVKIVTKASVEGAGALLGRICLPAAEEFGLLLRERVSMFRAANITAVTSRAEPLLNGRQDAHAHPRLVAAIVEQSSWSDDPVVQDLWAGLLVSSCDEDGEDDSNLVFVNLLSQLTKPEARVLNKLCEVVDKHANYDGLVIAAQVSVTVDQLKAIMQLDDLQRIDREIDHLNHLVLLIGGFDPDGGLDLVTAPSSLALHMYIRCQGSRLSPIDFFKLSIPERKPMEATPVRRRNAPPISL